MNISEFLAFADARSASFSSRVAPISDVLLEELLALAQKPLPPLYLSYLQTMGGDPDKFQRPRWTLDPYDVTGRACLGGYPRDRFTLFAVHRPSPIESPTDWYFDHADPECRVVQFEASSTGVIQERNVTPVFTSFDELLLDWGAHVFCFAELPFNRKIQLRANQAKRRGEFEDGMARCRAVVQRLGFKELLPPTRDAWLGGRGQEVVLVYALPAMEDTSFFVMVGGPEAKATIFLDEILRDNFI